MYPPNGIFNLFLYITCRSCKFESGTKNLEKAQSFKSFIVSSGVSASLFLRAYFTSNLSAFDRIIVESSAFSTDKPHKVVIGMSFLFLKYFDIAFVEEIK